MKKIIIIPLLLMLWTITKAQCPLTVTITGAYTTTYTGSNSWIATSGVTTIPSAANVTLDANPQNNGYVLIDVGFETQPSATFLAIVQTECFPLAINKFSISNPIEVYPNPMNDVLHIKAIHTITETTILDIYGKVILQAAQNSDIVKLNMSNFSAGNYLLKIITSKDTQIVKIVKQ